MRPPYEAIAQEFDGAEWDPAHLIETSYADGFWYYADWVLRINNEWIHTDAHINNEIKERTQKMHIQTQLNEVNACAKELNETKCKLQEIQIEYTEGRLPMITQEIRQSSRNGDTRLVWA